MKLHYELLIIEDVQFNIAKSKTKYMRITIKSDGKVFAVRNYRTTNQEFFSFLNSKLNYVRRIQKEVANKKEPIISVDELKEKIIKYVNQYKNLMQVEINKVSIRKMTTAFGSCTHDKKTIRFSTELTKYKDEFIEYVVVHELAHLIENNHSKNFWKIVEMYIPNYKTIRKIKNN